MLATCSATGAGATVLLARRFKRMLRLSSLRVRQVRIVHRGLRKCRRVAKRDNTKHIARKPKRDIRQVPFRPGDRVRENWLTCGVESRADTLAGRASRKRRSSGSRSVDVSPALRLQDGRGEQWHFAPKLFAAQLYTGENYRAGRRFAFPTLQSIARSAASHKAGKVGSHHLHTVKFASARTRACRIAVASS